MVSPLVTVDEFWRFYECSYWRRCRDERLRKTGPPEPDPLAPVNPLDQGYLPASVTWFDAVAYCRHIEQETGLPVGLLSVEQSESHRVRCGTSMLMAGET